MDEEVQRVVAEIEEEQALNRISGVQVFRSLLNQPNLVSLHSSDADFEGSSTGFSSLNFSLPRPILQASSIELTHSVLPQCVQNIPDTAITFWYYRLSSYKGNVPNANNLYFVRLLPSYYKPEFISSEVFGFNKTFNSYTDLAIELQKSCTTDLAFVNLKEQVTSEDSNLYKLQYLPNDISLLYNESINKFQMNGNNANVEMAFKVWDATLTYALNEVVSFGSKTYISLQNPNINNDPREIDSLFWKQNYVDIVDEFDGTTPYRQGQYVSYQSELYIARQNTIGQSPPDVNPTDWDDSMPSNFYKYLVTGFRDPIVAQVQANGRLLWNKDNLFEFGESVEYEGNFYRALKQNKSFEPFLVLTVPASWNNVIQYEKDDLVFFGTSFKASKRNINSAPSTFSDDWIEIMWEQSSQIDTPIIGLNSISSEFDMTDQFLGVSQYPFPNAIPGQPFVKNPKRLLNSILGFTWNGIMLPESLANIDSTITTAVSKDNSQTELFNRIRPIQQYFKRYTTLSLGGLQENIAKSLFTAEGYANLVYTNIISIFASIVAGSSLNTTTNTGLLGVCAMNTGNLGISFFQQGTVAPLTIHNADIYSILLYFQDEVGDPYFFTNNANLSFTLKVDYKNILQDK